MPTLKKFLQALVCVFIFLLPFQTRWIFQPAYLNGAFWEYGSASLYATELLLGLITLLAIFYFGCKVYQDSKAGKLKPQPQKLIFAGVGLLLFMAPIFIAQNHALAWQHFLYYFLGLIFILLIIAIKPNAQKIALTLVVSGFVQSLLAIMQFFQQKVYASKIFGIAEQLPQTLGTAVIEHNGERILRAYGSLPHPNILGGFLAITLLVCVILYAMELNRKKQLALMSSFIVGFFALLLSASRSALLAFFIGLVIYALFFRGQKTFVKGFNSIIVVIVFILIIATISQPALFSARLFGQGNLETKSTQERLGGYVDAWQIIKKQPQGVGYGNYTYALSLENPNQAAYIYQPLHNALLLALIETGVCGILSLLYLAYLIYRLFKRKILAVNQMSYSIMYYATGAALIIIALFDHYLYSLYFGIILSALVIGNLISHLIRKIPVKKNG